MPNSEWKDAIKEAYASAKKDVEYLETIEISHPTGGTFFLINNDTELTLTLETMAVETFEPVSFRLQRPKQGEQGSQELTFTVDNVDRRISQFLDSVKNSQQPTLIRYRPYLSSDLTAPQLTAPLELTIVEVSVSDFEVTARARFVEVLNRDFPNERYTRQRFPSLGG